MIRLFDFVFMFTKMAATESSFDRSAIKELFDVVADKGKNMIVKCKVCNKDYSTSKASTSNLKTHVEVG